MRNIVIENGNYTDVQSVPHKVFKGIVPSDLEVGDTFENDLKVVYKVTKKDITSEGAVIIQSKEV